MVVLLFWKSQRGPGGGHKAVAMQIHSLVEVETCLRKQIKARQIF